MDWNYLNKIKVGLNADAKVGARNFLDSFQSYSSAARQRQQGLPAKQPLRTQPQHLETQ